MKRRALQPQPGMLLLCCSVLLFGCSNTDTAVKRQRLADLPAFDRSILQQDVAVTEQQLDSLYQQILALQPEPQTRQKILYRLSQMHTNQLERAELPPDAEQAALQQLVSRYRQLLNDYPQDPNNELIRYQLARSYDLLGQQQACLEQLNILLQQYPDSGFAAEAWFRKADIHYSQGDYDAALPAFLAVLNGSDVALAQHGRYMAGWSYFKLQQFEQADEQFLQVLDQSYSELLLTEQQQPQQSLREEVLRTLSISLSYQQQGESLQALLKRVRYQRGERPLMLLAELYQGLAEFLASKDLIAASLDTYRLFIADYPHNLTAARFQLHIIQHYLAHADAEQALSAQQHYIGLFGPQSEFWRRAGREELAEVQPQLLQYLDYFARKQYAAAGAMPADTAAPAFAAVSGLWLQMLAVLQDPLLQQATAPGYSVADIRYLLAESYAGAAMTEQALTLYTELGYGPALTDASLFTAQDAAYKALLLSTELAALSEANALRLWQQQSDFVATHSSHPAAQQVALQQLQQRYNEQDYYGVLTHSNSVIQWPRAAQSRPELVQEAQFLHSQSELALQQYAAAEHSISMLLTQQLDKERRSLLTGQLASAIYQQAQQADATTEAVQSHLQRLLTLLPDSAYHEAAAYQQISLLLSAKSWAAAIPLLTAFIQRYPQTERGIAAKAQLLDSYERSEQWDKAAGELTKLATSATEPAQQREALYLAAQYYQRSGDTAKALDNWRSYANRYPQPHLLAQEARYQLVQLYQTQKDLYRQNFWRDKIAAFEQQFANEGNERTQQLAAQALLELGRHESGLFAAVRLAHPLAQSLKKKRLHMADAIKRYEQSMQYGIAGLLSEAQFRVAELYQQMAKALLDSDRPKGLDELALEEYELLLEEQAYPFEEQAIAIYQQNTRLTQQQLWDDWIRQSFTRLAVLLPAKFNKTEAYAGVADDAN
ncbi:tetratricopeptide repeat protein [Rheinheimera sp. NSM]|uniref:tetratricopeptide repeat protein n=1 Tax=Rheinheimera sp. NSM TaxID=3457884 RepID=UPI004036570A